MNTKSLTRINEKHQYILVIDRRSPDGTVSVDDTALAFESKDDALAYLHSQYQNLGKEGHSTRLKSKGTIVADFAPNSANLHDVYVLGPAEANGKPRPIVWPSQEIDIAQGHPPRSLKYGIRELDKIEMPLCSCGHPYKQHKHSKPKGCQQCGECKGWRNAEKEGGNSKFEFRVHDDRRAKWQQAADLEQRTLSDFIKVATDEKTNKVLAPYFRLSTEKESK